MSAFNKVACRQFANIDPDAGLRNAGSKPDGLGHVLDHSRLGLHCAAGANPAIYENEIVLQRLAANKIVLRYHRFKNYLDKIAWRLGSRAMDSGDIGHD